MNKQLTNCNPSICMVGNKNKPNELMSNDGEFITKEIYKNKCSSDCLNKSKCGTVIDLLQALKTDEAIDLLKSLKSNTAIDLLSNIK